MAITVPTDIAGCIGWWDPSDSAVSVAAVDDFNRANGGIGANYTTIPGSAIEPVIVGNQVLVTTYADTRRTAETWGADQITAMDVVGGGAAIPGWILWVSVRSNGTSLYTFTWSADSGGSYALDRWAGPSGDRNLGSSTFVGQTGTRRLEVRAIGSTISGWVNGVQVFTATDTDIPSGGTPGFGGGGGSGGPGLVADNLAVGSYGTNTVAVLDKSGGSRHLTAFPNGGTIVKGTKNGRSTLKKTGNSYLTYEGSNIIVGTTCTVVMVFNRTADATFMRGMAIGVSNDNDWNRVGYAAAISQENDIAGFPTIQRNGAKTGFATGLFQWHACMAVFGSAQEQMHLDGVLSSTLLSDPNGVFDVDDIIVANEPAGMTSPFLGEIGEIIVYTTALNSTQRTDLFNYLRNRWGFPSVYDDFLRANGAPGSNWTEQVVGSYLISGNRLVRQAGGSDWIMHNTAMGSPDHFAEAHIYGHTTASFTVIHARTNGMGITGDCYMCFIDPSGGGGNMKIGKNNSGTYADVGAAVAVPGGTAEGGMLRLEVEGNTQRGYWNGVLVVTRTDATIAADASHLNVGINASGTSAQYEDFAAGSLVPYTPPAGGAVDLAGTSTGTSTTTGALDVVGSAHVSSSIEEHGTSLGASNAQVLPAGAAAGDLVIYVVGSDLAGTFTAVTASTGWTAITNAVQTQGSTVITSNAFARVLDGTTGQNICSITGGAQDYVAIGILIKAGDHGVATAADIVCAGTTNTTGNVDPPAVTPGTSKRWLWLACAIVDLTTGNTITAMPTNYTLVQNIVSANSTSSVAVAVARRGTTGTTENPGTFTGNPTTRPWIGLTLAVPPGITVNALAGSSTGTSTATGSLSVDRPMAGTSTGTSGATGDLSVAGILSDVTDDFNRGDAALTTPWVKPGASAVNIAQIVSGRVTAPAPLGTFYAALYGTGTFGAYQTAQVDGSLGGDYSEINALARYLTTQNGYNFAYVTNGVLDPAGSLAGYACQIWRGTGGGAVTDYALIAEVPGPAAGVHRLKGYALGTRLVLTLDDKVLVDLVDPTGTVPAAGFLGISPHQSGAAGSTYIDNFAAKGYNAGALPTIPAPDITDDFTGSNGAAWPSPWSNLAAVGGGTTTIQGNKGDQSPLNSPSYQVDVRPWTPDDFMFTGDVDVTKGQGMQPRVLVRLSADFQRQTYFLPDIDGNTLSLMTTTDGNAANIVTVDTAAFTFVTGTYHVRMCCMENTVAVKIWSGATEPVNWQLQGNALDRHGAGGTISLTGVKISGSGVGTVRWDNVTLRDLTLTGVPSGGPVAMDGSSSGTSTVTGSLSVARAIAGTTAGLSTTTGALAVARAIAGQSDGVSTTTGAIAVARAFAGTVAGSSTAGAALAVARALTGQVDGVSTVANAVLAVARAMVASSAGTSTVTGDLTKASQTDLGAASSAGTSSATGSLSVARAMSGASGGLGTTSGALGVAVMLAGRSDGVGGASTPVLAVQRALAGSSDGLSGAQATGFPVNRGLVGRSDGTSTTTGDMVQGSKLLAGQSDGVSSATGSLSVTRGVAGSSSGVGGASGDLGRTVGLAGRSDGGSTADGSLSKVVALAGQSDGTSFSIGAMRRAVSLGGSSVGRGIAQAGTLSIITFEGGVFVYRNGGWEKQAPGSPPIEVWNGTRWETDAQIWDGFRWQQLNP